MNKLQLLKLLAPGFLPLIVFIVADSMWGTKVGLIVAVASGIVELLISWIKEKRLDSFVLLDTGLIIALGGISLLFHNDIFFLLKPALIELIFCLILGVSAFSGVNLMLFMSQRYLKNLAIGTEQAAQMRRSSRALFFIFLVHTLLIVYSAFFMSKKAWGFVSGGLFYILFFIYFSVEFFRGRVQRRKQLAQFADNEWFDVVDPEGKVIGRAPRKLCHSGPGLLHPVVHLQILNSEDRIFLQKRSMTKEIQPGKWDTAVGGHVRSGETVEAALRREAAEELGLENFRALPLARYVWESAVESELVCMFVARLESVPRLNRQEMDEGRFWRIKKIREELGKGMFTPNFEFEFDILVKNFLR